MKTLQTIGLVVEDGKILLGFKKRGFGEGRWNGFGGKVEKGETIEAAMKREVLEESGIKALKYQKLGVINFHFADKDLQPEVHIFVITKYDGEPKESEEMKPRWFSFDKIPYDQMWPADGKWLPAFLAGKKFSGDIYFENNNVFSSVELKVKEDKNVTKKVMTLALLEENGKILLGKLKGGFAAGRYNGFGGKLEPGETPFRAMKRECLEECGIRVTKAEKVGLHHFYYLETNTVMEVYLYRILKYTGQPVETEEMVPEWFSLDKIPYELMWPDDEHWMPIFLAGKRFNTNFTFKDYSEILSYKIYQ